MDARVALETAESGESEVLDVLEDALGAVGAGRAAWWSAVVVLSAV